MKYFLKIAAIIFSMAMLFSFSGCQPTVNGDGNTTPPHRDLHRNRKC